jgi:20S proteasome alpha/beta subunit
LFIESKFKNSKERRKKEKKRKTKTDFENMRNRSLFTFITGLEEKDGEVIPYISAYDLIGAGLFADDFVLAGTASEQLYGLCESFYKPDMVSMKTDCEL